jgi:hypothetical protein
LLGYAALAASAILLLVYAAWLGHPLANTAFGLLISIHCTGFVYYCNPWLAGEPFQSRLAFTLLALMAMLLGLYLPARSLVQHHVLTPLQTNGKVIVVQRLFPPRNIQRGDWMAYSLTGAWTGEAHNGGAVWIHDGVGFGPVLAVAGDQVDFSEKSYSINGAIHPALPHMPQSGTWIVPEKHWFIWPNLDISGHGNVTEGRISETLLGLADVRPEQILGQPVHRWFWREQNLP